MKKEILIASILLLFSSTAVSADRVGHFSVKDALARGYKKGVIDRSIPIVMKGQKAPAFGQKVGNYRSSKKTNALGKSDKKACQWVFLSAVKSLLERAKQEGGTAIIDVISVTEGKAYVSPTQFECVSGTLVSKVALKGVVVK